MKSTSKLIRGTSKAIGSDWKQLGGSWEVVGRRLRGSGGNWKLDEPRVLRISRCRDNLDTSGRAVEISELNSNGRMVLAEASSGPVGRERAHQNSESFIEDLVYSAEADNTT